MTKFYLCARYSRRRELRRYRKQLERAGLFGTNATADSKSPRARCPTLIAYPSSISLCALEYRISKVRPGCAGASEIGIGQIRTRQIRAAQIGPGEIGT